MRSYDRNSGFAFRPVLAAVVALCTTILVFRPADLVAQQKMRTAWRHPREGGVGVVVFSPDGKLLANAGSERMLRPNGRFPVRDLHGVVRVWDSHTEKCLRQFDFDPDSVPLYVAFLPSGDALRVGTIHIHISSDGRFQTPWRGEVLRYDLRTGKSKREWTAAANERIVALWADMAVAAWGEKDTGKGRSGVKLINLNTGKVTARPFEGPFRLLGLSQDRKLALLERDITPA